MTTTVSGSSRPLRVAIYARTSTSRDQSPASQLHALRQLAEQRGWQVVGEFVDHGVSGSKDRRPQLDEMMRVVHRGGCDAIAVWKFDRAARSVRHLVLMLDELNARGVAFVSVNDMIDTTTPTGRFTFTLIAAVAELEKSILRARTVAGLDAARARGARLGRPPVEVDVERALALRAENRSYREIGRILGVGATTVHRALIAADGRVSESRPESAVDAVGKVPEFTSDVKVA